MEGLPPPPSSSPAKENLVKESDSLPGQSEEQRTPSLLPVSPIGANWPSLPTSQESSCPIPPGQKSMSPPEPSPSTPAGTWKVKQKDPADYNRDRMGKYAEFFVGNEILPIPEIIDKIVPRIVSLVTDLKTRRLVGLKKENFEVVLRASGVLCQYFCRKSFAIWDVLANKGTKAASNNLTTKFFRLQPEYMGTRRIRVSVCNVPAFVTGGTTRLFPQRIRAC